MSNLLEKYQTDMELRNFSPNTRRVYLSHVRHFAEFCQKPLEKLGETLGALNYFNFFRITIPC